MKEYLDIREINGYSIRYTDFNEDLSTHTSDKPNGVSRQIQCLVYIGLPDNPQFLGPQDPQALAEHIVRSRGPSGENLDYLYELETALNNLSASSVDEHVSDLAQRCRDIQAKAKKIDPKQSDEVIGSALKNVGSSEEYEEVEKA